jgi:hypothetical protein
MTAVLRFLILVGALLSSLIAGAYTTLLWGQIEPFCDEYLKGKPLPAFSQFAIQNPGAPIFLCLIPWCIFLGCAVWGKAGDGGRWFFTGFAFWVSFEGLVLIVLNSAWLLPALSLVTYMCEGAEGWTVFELASAAVVVALLVGIAGLAGYRFWKRRASAG